MTQHPRALALLVATTLTLFAAVACGDDTEPVTNAAPTAAASEPIDASVEPSPTVEETPPEIDTIDTKAQAQEIISCLDQGGMEAKDDSDGIPVWGEKAVIAVTFEFESANATVPGAVELLLFATPEKAAKAKPQIDKNLLEGDTETQLFGNVVVDDFGTTMTEAEAEDQANIVVGCVEG